MRSVPTQKQGFIVDVSMHLRESPEKYGTTMRTKEMLTVTNEELEIPSVYHRPGSWTTSTSFHCDIAAILRSVTSRTPPPILCIVRR